MSIKLHGKSFSDRKKIQTDIEFSRVFVIMVMLGSKAPAIVQDEDKGVPMILSCQNISKAFGTECIVTQASFHIEDHEKAAIVGINGAGKTTLLRMIVGRA